MPDPVHEDAQQRSVANAERLHADNGHMKVGDDKDDQHIGEKETRNGYEKVSDKSRGTVIKSSSENRSPDPDRKRESPCKDCSHNKEGQAVEEPIPDFGKHGLAVFPGYRFPCKEIPVKIDVLDVKRLVQMEFFAETISTVNLGLSGFTWLGFPGAR